jgi:hypothetical protein
MDRSVDRRTNRFGRSGLTLGLVLGLAGCHSVERGQPPVALEASPRPYEPDIPVPAGFVLADRSSEDWQSGPLRYIRHDYRGSADKYAVRQFYRDYMPRVRWGIVSDSSAAGRYSMTFLRGTETCAVIIEDNRSGGRGSVRIEITIAPVDRRDTLKSET